MMCQISNKTCLLWVLNWEALKNKNFKTRMYLCLFLRSSLITRYCECFGHGGGDYRDTPPWLRCNHRDDATLWQNTTRLWSWLHTQNWKLKHPGVVKGRAIRGKKTRRCGCKRHSVLRVHNVSEQQRASGTYSLAGNSHRRTGTKTEVRWSKGSVTERGRERAGSHWEQNPEVSGVFNENALTLV